MPNELDETGVEDPLAGDPQWSPQMMQLYVELYDKKFIPVDPVTKKPHALAKDFFWKVVGGPYGATRAGENMNAPVPHFEIQRYWRAKFQPARTDPKGNQTGNPTQNLPWSGRDYDGSLIPGSAQISYPELKSKYVEDR
jgi:hypothetical protein